METNCAIEPSVSKLETHLGYLLRRVSNAVSGDFARALHARQTSVAEWVLLRHLYDGEHVTPGELADALTMSRGAISKIIDKLQIKGWVKSRTKPQDCRVQLLSLTAVGQRVLPELAEIADRNDERFFASLDAGERSALGRLLGKLRDHHQIRDVPVQ
jgi:DNA-binding MarR family transcriptional regulator